MNLLRQQIVALLSMLILTTGLLHHATVQGMEGGGGSAHYLPFLTRNVPAQLNPPFKDYVALIVSDVDGDNEIYTMRGDGSDLRQLTSNEIDEAKARLSPDGTMIAYIEIEPAPSYKQRPMLMNRDGSNVRPIGDGLVGSLVDMRWSPDSQQLIVHVWNRPYLQILLATPDGTTTEISVDTLPDYYYFELYTDWSPNGRYFYHLWDDPDSFADDLWMVTAATADTRLLKSYPSGVKATEWHPDSSEILIEDTSRGWMLEPDGSGERLLYEGGLQFQAWGTAGRVALLSQTIKNSYYNLFSIPRAGGTPTAITNDPFGIRFRVEPLGKGIIYWTIARQASPDSDFYWYSLESETLRPLLTVTPYLSASATSPSVTQDGSGLLFTILDNNERTSSSDVYYTPLHGETVLTLLMERYDVWTPRYLPYSSGRAVVAMTYFYEGDYPKTKIPAMIDVGTNSVTSLPFLDTFFDVSEWRYLPAE